MMTKLIGNKKGVSPTVSSIIMIVLVVAAMSLVISFSQTIISNRNAQMGEKLCVEKVSFSSTRIMVQVRNIGHGFMTLEQIKINEQLYTINKVVLPDLEANPAGLATPVTAQGQFFENESYEISFISSLNNNLGNTEVICQLTRHTLTLTIVGSGTVAKSPDQAIYYLGDTVQLTASPAAGWTFAGWSGDLTGTTNPQSIIMNGNKAVTAIFTQNQYTLTVTTSGSGTGQVVKSPDQATYTYGTVVQLTATADIGSIFVGWSGDLTGTTNPQSIIMNGNKAVTAQFKRLVTFISAGTGSGTTGNPQPNYPTGLLENDLILLQVTVRDTLSVPITPSGFNLLYGPDQTSNIGRQWIYYRFATGTEFGPLIINIGGSNCKIARMYAFRSVALSGFTEGTGFRSGTVSTISAQPVTTAGDGRLAVSFVFVTDDNSVDSFTGESGGDWVETTQEFTSTAGSDGCVQLQTATIAGAGTISGGSYGMGSSDPWGVRAFALVPIT